MYAQCEEALSKCTKCSGSHHTSTHDEVRILRKARDDRIGKMKPRQPDVNSSKKRINRMGLNAKVAHEDEGSEEDAQINAMIAIEKSIREEEDVGPPFLDEDAYIPEIIIAGEFLKNEIVLCKLAELEEKAERISEEEVITAMKALRVMDDEQDKVIFDTGCTAHVLRSGEGLFDLRKAPDGSCIKGVGDTAAITHIGKMLGIGRVFVAPEGANLISVSQLAEAGASFSGDSRELVVKDGTEIFKARPSQSHRELYVMNGEDF
jgi:hypothetical protein